MRGRCALAQDRVGLLRYILDLHTRHGAIMALEAPIHNYTILGYRWVAQTLTWISALHEYHRSRGIGSGR